MTLHKGTELEAAIGSGAAVQAAILTGDLLLFARHSCVNGFGDRPRCRDDSIKRNTPHGLALKYDCLSFVEYFALDLTTEGEERV